MNKKGMIGLMVLFCSMSLLFGHGIKLTVVDKYPCIIVNAKYHGSKDLANANVTVFFEKEANEFQKGNTDKNGNFCFYPDQTGKWMVTVDDGMGHRKTKEIVIGSDFFTILPPEPEPEPKKEEPIPVKKVKETKEDRDDICCYLLKIVLGIFLILLVTFILYRWRKRQEK
jgi:nickel transport protein